MNYCIRHTGTFCGPAPAGSKREPVTVGLLKQGCNSGSYRGLETVNLIGSLQQHRCNSGSVEMSNRELVTVDLSTVVTVGL